MSTHQRMPVLSLAGGVGRQAANKRLPTEAQELDNVLITTERSAEKRPGLEHIAGSDQNYVDQATETTDTPAPGSLLFNYLSDNTTRYVPEEEDRIFFKWISLDQENRYLIGINYSLRLANSLNLTADDKRKFLTVWKLNKTLKRMELQDFDFDSITLDHYNYIVNSQTSKLAEEVLEFALFGSALILLNKSVEAGYRENMRRNIDGTYKNTVVDLTNTTKRMYAYAAAGEGFAGLEYYDSTGIKSTKTLAGVSEFGNEFGVQPSQYVFILFTTAGVEVARYRNTKFLEPNKTVNIPVDDLELISGTAPVVTGNNTIEYKFKVEKRVRDLQGQAVKYRSSSLPDTVGKNLVPISLTTRLDALNNNPIDKLFGTEKTVHLLDNTVSSDPAGNVKDVSAAVTGDKYYGDKFFITRGSVFYSVELNEYDTAKEPGSLQPSNIDAADTYEINLSDLQVTQKLRPLKSFKATGVVTNSDKEITNAGTVLDADVELSDTPVTLETLKNLIEGAGADATLKIDSSNNRISIVDDSTENLTLTATHENFAGIVGNQNFIDTLGLTNSNSKSIKRIDKDTTLKSFTDSEGAQLITVSATADPADNQAEGINGFILYEEQIANNDGIQEDRILHSISNNDLQSIASNFDAATLEDLAGIIFNSTNGEYVLCYADNFKEVGFTHFQDGFTIIEDGASDNSNGVLIMTYNGGSTTGRTAVLVQDKINDTSVVSSLDVTYTKTGDFATKMGLRNCLRDYKLVVEDKNFNVATQTDLGQSIVSFQNIPVPPEENDTTKVNSAHHTLFSLSEGSKIVTGVQKVTNATVGQKGKGKVYECRERFFDFVPGFYRTVNEPGEGSPYYEPVRAEDEFSVLDERTWPIVLDFDGTTNKWKLVTPSWLPRISGSKQTNPGPSPLIGNTSLERQRKPINALTVWRNRLWFAIDDTVFCSEFGNFFNVFLTDPNTIVDTDVIDIRSSVDKISSINNMIGFYDFLFINTDNDIQFELQGSENQVTPFTAELSPTTFYSTDPFSRPQLLGSQIYFFAPEKIYLYYSTANQSSITQAVETSAHAEGYLPASFGDITTAPTQDMIAMIDKNERNNIYFYTNRFSGDKVLQNSLHRYVFSESFKAWALESFDNYLYIVNTQPFKKSTGSKPNHYFVSRTFLEAENSSVPRLDNLIQMQIRTDNPITGAVDESNTSYDSNTNKTTIILPFADEEIDTVVPVNTWPTAGQAIEAVNNTENGKRTRIVLEGDYSDFASTENQGLIIDANITAEDNQRFLQETVFEEEDQGFLYNPPEDGVSSSMYFGKKFDMNIELSPQLVRDREQNVIDGVLNLRSILTRYDNSGEYDIVVQKRGEETARSVTTKRDPFYKEGLYGQTKLDQIIPVTNEGEFLAKVFGDSESTRVFIKSNSFTPCNITHIEFKGIFKQTYRSTQN